MIKTVLAAICSLFLGLFGWAQIIGSIQNLSSRKSLLFTLILWIIIMIGCGIFFFTWMNASIGLVIGYVVSLLMVLSSGKIE